MGYPNDRRNTAGAIPVYMVPTPPVGPPWPNKQNTGGIPISIVAAPISADSGAIPVRFVAGGSAPDAEGRWPSDQGLGAGAIPVYTSPAGMPVWDATGIPPPAIPVNTIPPSIGPIGPVSSGTGLYINTGTWTNNPMSFYFSWRRNGNAIIGASMNLYLTVAADIGTVIDAVVLSANSGGNSVGVLTSNQVSVT
jgi:hypothetical protein